MAVKSKNKAGYAPLPLPTHTEGSDWTVGPHGDKSQRWIMRSIVVVDVVVVDVVVVVVFVCVCVGVCVCVCVFTCVYVRFGPSMFLFSGCVYN